jgi:hypothetical protein
MVSPERWLNIREDDVDLSAPREIWGWKGRGYYADEAEREDAFERNHFDE